jgi:hypothetical protein
MYKIAVNNKGIVIIEKNLSKEECESIEGDNTRSRSIWLIDAFKKYIGLDISNYNFSEYVSGSNYFIISIREEDLIKLREDKLNHLFI